jgi:hypothetical protein
VALLAGGTVLGRLSTGLALADAVTLTDVNFSLAGSNEAGSGDVVDREEFASTTAALAVLQRAQQDYERAALFLATHDTSTSEGASELYRQRLAALDAMAEASLSVLERSPADPVMNQMYLSTLGAREATLTKLGTALPVGARLTRF